VRVGVTLPTFRDDAFALQAAGRAEELGLDGVFVFDHLWPLGAPQRPALSAFPTLGAVAASTRTIGVGTLVARIGLVPDEILVAQLLTVHHMAPGRLIAGLGTGDAQSAGENLAFGIPFDAADERRLSLRACAAHLAGAGVEVWVGGGSAATNQVAVDLGVAVNLWGAPPAVVAALRSRCEVTWAGPVGGESPEIALWLEELSTAGATWAVCAWPPSIEAVAEAAASVRSA
jgi:alkanesulfonate monooxygenase SsuD/methylene tetrahydromethanopterin reductase-like flavin-dependent oxidoreductase (luciferase family)